MRNELPVKADSKTSHLSVLVVDDTAIYRSVLKDAIQNIQCARFADSAANGKIALDKMSHTAVDFVLLDMEMPEMNGIETLDKIQEHYPEVGVVMVSGENQASASDTIEALNRGALDFVAKPDCATPEENHAFLVKQLGRIMQSYMISRNLRAAEQLRVRPLTPIPSSAILPALKFDMLVIGISTGGPKALMELLPKLPADLGVPVLIVQHMPPVFTASLAESLNNRSALTIREACEGQEIEPGTVLIAPGDRHMIIQKASGGHEKYRVGLNNGPPENSCRPSVDVLFRSVAEVHGRNTLAVIMTGMGEDGLRGVRFLKERGSTYCLTQSMQTCVIYGMPKAVVDAKLSDETVSLQRLAPRIVSIIKRKAEVQDTA
ncbi:MAG: chemotaxis-specific protein-glutamate methyltransferase CheB [Myxococcota bacterium]|nr:chemotaxis-specific protein-glutamate methyltransferase CheB [Myxococcota bacterium]